MNTTPARNPGLNIGFLVGDTSRMLRRIFNARLTHLGLTQAQWRALAHLSRNEGINQVTLSDLLDVQPITVARFIDKLVEANLVHRRPDPNDRRAQRLFLAEKAQTVLEQIWDVADETYAVVLKGLTETERDTLIELLTRIRTNTGTLQPTHSVSLTNSFYPNDKNGK
ncbi:MAG: MarR family winged helix-turn-helix transcriptional regulator [Pseudomonadota bacterium]